MLMFICSHRILDSPFVMNCSDNELLAEVTSERTVCIFLSWLWQRSGIQMRFHPSIIYEWLSCTGWWGSRAGWASWSSQSAKAEYTLDLGLLTHSASAPIPVSNHLIDSFWLEGIVFISIIANPCVYPTVCSWHSCCKKRSLRWKLWGAQWDRKAKCSCYSGTVGWLMCNKQRGKSRQEQIQGWQDI